jgi:hypothetical protein
MANVIALSCQWTKCTNNENENHPVTWFVELDGIRECFSSKSSAISDGAYVAHHVINNLTEVYKSLVLAGKIWSCKLQAHDPRGQKECTQIL